MTQAPDDPAASPRLLGKPVEVSLIAANLPFVLRTFAGMTSLVVGANVVGVLVVALTTIGTNATATRHQLTVLLTGATILVVVQVIVGTTAGALVQRRTMRWLLRGERPSNEDAHRALRMPLDMSIIVAILWFVGDIAISAVSAGVGLDGKTVLGVTGGIALAGLASAGITYLLVGRVSGPVARLALASRPPESAPVFGVRWRLFIIWLMTTGAPVVGIVLLLSAPRDVTNVRQASVLVACVALLLGGVATALTARAIGAPLRGMVDVLRRVGQGDLDVAVEVEDAGEIGLLQSGVNDMVSGLRERDRVTDLFGRHVGSSVAQEALRSGVTLSGELRDVVAVFVDITGSMQRTRDADPKEFVAMLNRFYEIVVEEVEGSGGLLNKFEGDAALCVFGAPVELIDPASSGLKAARLIRDRVFAMGEVEVGIGVAAGPVVAGQVGTRSRLEFTVIGDAVNEAARLTDLAKAKRQHLLASEEVIARAGETEKAHWDPDGEVVLRGRELPTRLWTA
ncbi:MAG: adenylate cyclase [Pseudonocardiales bacterium]|nr:adenylate cyclase [Pseudonocardiales bacterium]MDT4950560.1 adenylate cyclase [Pseudonocardiales bacterium]